MTAPSTPGGRPAAMRLAGIGLLAAAVAVALHVAGRVHTVNPALSLFGRQFVAAVALKAVLATVALGLAALQVLLALCGSAGGDASGGCRAFQRCYFAVTYQIGTGERPP